MSDRAPDPSRRSERSRQAILAAAFELLGESGYAKLTIEAIAARAGVGKQTIYRWWPSKGSVLFDAFLAFGEDRVLELPDTGDLAADLRSVARSGVDELVNPRFDLPYRALLTEVQHDPGLSAELLDQFHGPLLAATKQRLRGAQETGEVAADLDLDLAFELLWGAFYYRWLLRTGPLTHDYADAAVALVLRALSP
ncbi:TetR/AcrR family transcriptional regulator [Amycolatopsis nigrescens]|uniref:TetR/AcrR family transcriptional regulator n=1 Tax=Amycolatopsis nigrescens TaxID=381445 RepID=UPI000380CB2D|nr:TetR/AcrR family transcriptional regulator [Amycolatopsis nigrescens]